MQKLKHTHKQQKPKQENVQSNLKPGTVFMLFAHEIIMFYISSKR